jgi:membrane protein
VVVGGAVLTTALVTALKEVFATYLSHLTSYSAYGVAGGVLALATWIYLSSMIVFFGAQLTRIHAEKSGAVKACDMHPTSPPSRWADRVTPQGPISSR